MHESASGRFCCNHSEFSHSRNERFREGKVFGRVFERVVEACIAAGPGIAGTTQNSGAVTDVILKKLPGKKKSPPKFKV
jgi:hypothetical protein